MMVSALAPHPAAEKERKRAVITGVAPRNFLSWKTLHLCFFRTTDQSSSLSLMTTWSGDFNFWGEKWKKQHAEKPMVNLHLPNDKSLAGRWREWTYFNFAKAITCTRTALALAKLKWVISKQQQGRKIRFSIPRPKPNRQWHAWVNCDLLTFFYIS
jgi:hypothetical protein